MPPEAPLEPILGWISGPGNGFVLDGNFFPGSPVFRITLPRFRKSAPVSGSAGPDPSEATAVLKSLLHTAR